MISAVVPFLSLAFAGFIQIQSNQSWNLSKDGLFAGTYELENHGDEVALRTHIEIQAGRWAWKSLEYELRPGQKQTIAVAQSIPLGDLQCSLLPSCREFPLVGRIPIKIIRHYQDANGYSFSAPDLAIVGDGELPLPFEIQLNLTREADLFSLRYSLRNLTDQTLQLFPNLILPEEVENTSVFAPIELRAHRQLEGRFFFSNVRALPGSQYAATLILQWQEQGVRQVLVKTNSFLIEENLAVLSRDSRWNWVVGIGIFFLGWLLIGFFVLWPLARAKKQISH